MENNLQQNERYNLAYKRVKRIKGFYIHLLVYVLVNGFMIGTKYFYKSDSFSNETFLPALFWGFGLLAQGFVVFGDTLFFGKNWEDRKIQEFIEKEKKQRWE